MPTGRVVRFGIVLAAVVLCGCRTGRNYADPAGPRYSGGNVAYRAPSGSVVSLRVVTFNIEHAQHLDAAIDLLREDPVLRNADVVLLQEMNAPAVRRVADSLGLSWVYYPAIFHYRGDHDFGNAILSRWPIVSDAKLVLPFSGLLSSTQRIATAATLCVAGAPVRVYSAHLGTVVEILPDERRSQLRAILRDAEPYSRVIVGGDMNDEGVGVVAVGAGYVWPTRRGPRTTPLGRWDHIFTRGFGPDAIDVAETVEDNRGSSDHRPVRVDVELSLPGRTSDALPACQS